jgi:hypothetical protein
VTTIRQQIYQSLLADIDASMDPPVFLNEPATQFLEEGLSYAVLLTPDRPTVESETIGLEHYEFSEELELEIYIKDSDAIDRVSEVDAIAESLASSIHRSKLGGLATIVLVGPYSVDQEDVLGAAPVGYGRIPITVHYQSESPVG